MAFDVNKWLAEDLGFNAEEVAALGAKFASVADKLEGGFLRQSDYSRLTNEITTAKADLAEQNRKVNEEMVEWSKLTAAEKAASAGLRANMEASQAESLRLRQIVERVAAEAGMDVTKVLEGVPVTKVETPAAPAAPDMSGYVTAAQYQGLANMALHLPAELLAMAEEHKQLFGTALDTRALAKTIDERARDPRNQKSLDPRVVWDELNSVGAKREAIATEKYNADIAAAEDRGRIAARTEQALPGPGRPGQTAPVFSSLRGHESVLKRPAPESSHNAAVTAFTSGKYR